MPARSLAHSRKLPSLTLSSPPRNQLFATAALNENSAESVTVADGSIYSSAFFLVFLVNLALIAVRRAQPVTLLRLR